MYLVNKLGPGEIARFCTHDGTLGFPLPPPFLKNLTIKKQTTQADIQHVYALSRRSSDI
jgi:hypothetical protein